MRCAPVVGLLVAILAIVGCGAGPAPLPSPLPSAGDLPPAWVQSEVMWQSLAAGEAHPRICQWTLIRSSRAASLHGHDTSYLRAYRGATNKAYVIIVRGRFSKGEGPPGTADYLYLVIRARLHDYLAHGLLFEAPEVAGLGPLHTFVPQPPSGHGVWGHTMMEGGAFPGGPDPLGNVPVDVWAGRSRSPSGTPLTTLQADTNGFFMIDLPPGVYTFRLSGDNHGMLVTEIVTAKAHQLVTAGVYGSVP